MSDDQVDRLDEFYKTLLGREDVGFAKASKKPFVKQYTTTNDYNPLTNNCTTVMRDALYYAWDVPWYERSAPLYPGAMNNYFRFAPKDKYVKSVKTYSPKEK